MPLSSKVSTIQEALPLDEIERDVEEHIYGVPVAQQGANWLFRHPRDGWPAASTPAHTAAVASGRGRCGTNPPPQ